MKITNELIESAKDFANKINAQFVSIEKNKYFEIVLKIIDENNKPKSIKFRRNPEGHPFIKVAGHSASYQCKNLSKNGTPLNNPWNWQSLKLLDNIK